MIDKKAHEKMISIIYSLEKYKLKPLIHTTPLLKWFLKLTILNFGRMQANGISKHCWWYSHFAKQFGSLPTKKTKTRKFGLARERVLVVVQILNSDLIQNVILFLVYYIIFLLKSKGSKRNAYTIHTE